MITFKSQVISKFKRNWYKISLTEISDNIEDSGKQNKTCQYSVHICVIMPAIGFEYNLY